MVSLYLFCLIVGGGLLAFSLLGHHGDGSGDVHGDGYADGHVGGPDGDVHHAGHDYEGGPGWALAKEFLSIRSFFYLLAGFGATGLLIEGLTDASGALAFAFAAATGLSAAVVAGLVYGWLKHSESGTVPATSDHLVGLTAEVVLPVLERGRGKVRLIAGGRQLEMLARLYGEEDSACPRGSTVVIVDIQGDTALVAPMPSLPAELIEE